MNPWAYFMVEISFPNGVANTKKMFIRITATITAGAGTYCFKRARKARAKRHQNRPNACTVKKIVGLCKEARPSAKTGNDKSWKWVKSYSEVSGYVDARMSIAIVWATHRCLRGSHELKARQGSIYSVTRQLAHDDSIRWVHYFHFFPSRNSGLSNRFQPSWVSSFVSFYSNYCKFDFLCYWS
jgi:hypothetical protein